MADHPLRSATDRRLGRPLPHQLTNQTQVHPIPINLWPLSHAKEKCYEVLITVSSGYPSVWGRLPTRYSPVRRFPSDLSSEDSITDISLDLHVLGTPPAFILSQDQTLKKWYLHIFRCLNQSLSSRSETLCASLFVLQFPEFPNYCCFENCTGFPFTLLDSNTEWLYIYKISVLCCFQCSLFACVVFTSKLVYINMFFRTCQHLF